MSNNKDLRKIIKKYRKRGFVLVRSNKHEVYKNIYTGGIVTVSTTTSNKNAVKNIERDFRRGCK